MDKCPYCGSETRPGDNFCLNCGNRLLGATPSPLPQQAQQGFGEATLAAPEDWMGGAIPGVQNTPPVQSAPSMPIGQSMPGYPSMAGIPSGGSWPTDGGATLVDGQAEPTYRSEAAPVEQEPADKVSQPSHFILRSDNGDVLQEYTLDKFEISIGRAPNSDILLSKDKLTSRRHAIVRFENNQYLLRDERSANGTFVNGQQIEEMTFRVLQDGDHVGIGEHELIFRAPVSVEDMKTIVAPVDGAPAEVTFRTREDPMATMPDEDSLGTHSMEDVSKLGTVKEEPVSAPAPELVAPIAVAPSKPQVPNTPTPLPPTPTPVSESTSVYSEKAVSAPAASYTSGPISIPANDGNANFRRFGEFSLPTLPDISALMAALSTLDGQVMSLQEQLNAAHESLRGYESDVHQTASQLRQGIRRVSDRMDSTIAEVARSREALAWTELLQLMEDVMNNPRDIEYVTKLARKARELNKVFQIQQNVLNTMAECNSLLRSMMTEEK